VSVRADFAAWSVVFSERGDGDLRVSSRGEGEPLEAVQARILELLGVAAVAVGRQVHGADVVVIDEAAPGYATGVAEADGVATGARGVAVGVHVADCLPIAVGGAGGVAMLHGGWRGLAGGVVAEGVRALRALGALGELEAVIGPGAGGCCYETGDEVREQFRGYRASRGRLLDLKAIAAAQLREVGVVRVRDLGICTICSERGRLFSHRRDGPATGRQGGFAWLA
jgi:purine-nucleoside/S-methyl-5'-thioadenosine phosphorylase / adenosine deaminase